MPGLRARFFELQRRRRAGGLPDLHRRRDRRRRSRSRSSSASSPPWWVHVLLWVPLTAVLTIGLLRLGKGLLLALEYQAPRPRGADPGRPNEAAAGHPHPRRRRGGGDDDRARHLAAAARAQWKERLLAEYAAAAAMPAVDLDPLLDGRPRLAAALLPPRAGHLRTPRDAAPDVHAGRSAGRRASARSISSPAARARAGLPGGSGSMRAGPTGPTRCAACRSTGIVAGRLSVGRRGRADHPHRRHRRAAARAERAAGDRVDPQQPPALRLPMVLLRGGGGS